MGSEDATQRKTISARRMTWVEVTRLQRELGHISQAQTIRDIFEAGIRTLRQERLGQVGIIPASSRKSPGR
jgi:hypothetical protein